jgi:TonB family protein
MSREQSAARRSSSGAAFLLAAFLIAAWLSFHAVPAYSGQAEKEQARQEPEEQVYDLGPGITPPRVVRQVSPQYSGSRGVRVVGSVTIGLVVTSRGRPKNPQIVKSLEKDVDKSAVEAVQQWKFDPAKKDGKPVAVRITLEIDFHSL